MNNIISLTGAKQSGKVELGFKLAENSAVQFVKAYTDRKSNQLIWEDCYIFVSSEKLDELLVEREVLHITNIQGNRYVFFKDQLTASYNILIVDDYGVVDLRDKYTNNLYSIKVVSKNQKPSNRVDVYLYNHEFDKVFDVDNDKVEELEWEIESNLPLR